jgi:hypothetical protein
LSAVSNRPGVSVLASVKHLWHSQKFTFK